MVYGSIIVFEKPSCFFPFYMCFEYLLPQCNECLTLQGEPSSSPHITKFIVQETVLMVRMKTMYSHRELLMKIRNSLHCVRRKPLRYG